MELDNGACPYVNWLLRVGVFKEFSDLDDSDRQLFEDSTEAGILLENDSNCSIIVPSFTNASPADAVHFKFQLEWMEIL